MYFAYKAAKKRLVAYPVILEKIAGDMERIKQLSQQMPNESTTAIAANLKASLVSDQYEADLMAAALDGLSEDPYYPVLARKYLENASDSEISRDLYCDSSTVRRNRGRLIKQLAIRLYGAKALGFYSAKTAE